MQPIMSEDIRAGDTITWLHSYSQAGVAVQERRVGVADHLFPERDRWLLPEGAVVWETREGAALNPPKTYGTTQIWRWPR